MRRWAIVITGLAGILAMQACVLGFEQVRGSGNVTSRDISQEGFTRLHLGSGCRAQVTYGSNYSVVVRIDDNLADAVAVERKGSELSISLKPMRSYRGVTFEADITMPDIDALHLSGGTKCVLTGFDLGHDVNFGLSGGSELDGSVTATDVDFSLSGGSVVELMGQGSSVRLGGSGGSRFDLGDFNAGDVVVDFSGGTNGSIRTNGELSGSLSGGSYLYYIGEPRLGHISKSGGSDVRAK